jgi:glutaminase
VAENSPAATSGDGGRRDVAGALAAAPVQEYLEQLRAELAGLQGGELADYIPELTRADPDWFGVALATVDGHVYQAGDSRQRFTVQSISKAIAYGLALSDRGLDAVLAKVGVEPSGEAFNSISLEPDTGRPLNPMINAGAIATTALVRDDEAPALERLLDTFALYTGRGMDLDEAVFRSERETGHRNRAIAHLLRGHGILERTPEDATDLYFQQCSIRVTARDLAVMAGCLANGGVNPVTGVVALERRWVDKVLAVMSTCGMYDYSGGWIFNVGMPAKSGVGGGIMAVLPGQFGLGVFSPPLDAKGNSVRGIAACERISRDFGLHLFNVARATSAMVLRRSWDCRRDRPRRERGAAEQAVLADQGGRVRVYELQGELMFGSVESVELAMLTNTTEAECLIVDLRRVVGISDAAARLLLRFARRLAGDGRQVHFTGAGHLYGFRRLLQKSGGDHATVWLAHTEVERAVEACEQQLLDAAGLGGGALARATDLKAHYLCAGLSDAQVAAVRGAGAEHRYPPGADVLRIGDRPASLFFVLEGEAEAWVPGSGGAPGVARRQRLKTLGPGTVFGEVGILDRQGRSANVSAVTACTCLEVPFAGLEPAIREHMLASMAQRFAAMLRDSTDLVRDLA